MDVPTHHYHQTPSSSVIATAFPIVHHHHQTPLAAARDLLQ
jgi:hypothetical protein